MASSVLHPPVLWAQREDVVYLTIDLHDAQNAQIELKEQSIGFENTTDGNEYAFHLDFYKPIKPNAGKKSATGRRVFLVLDKAEGEWWPRLTKENQKPNFLKTDFDLWKDADDSEDEEPAHPGMDFSQMGMGDFGGPDALSNLAGAGGLGGLGNLGGMGDLGGMDDNASSDEDMEEETSGKAKIEEIGEESK
ncbi:HSP20-like chaperone [Coemansia spiralis]|nr:HSP20-like chaperone [Coemansia spiralis]